MNTDKNSAPGARKPPARAEASVLDAVERKAAEENRAARRIIDHMRTMGPEAFARAMQKWAERQDAWQRMLDDPAASADFLQRKPPAPEAARPARVRRA